MAKAVHTMVRVLDLDCSITFYQDAFGLAETDRFDFKIKLTLDKCQTEPYELGNGYGHPAVSVENLEAEHRRFGEAGFEPGRLVTLERWRGGRGVFLRRGLG